MRLLEQSKHKIMMPSFGMVLVQMARDHWILIEPIDFADGLAMRKKS